jgi:hypothetical protein
LIDEEYDNHRCSPKINGKIQVIEVDFWIRAKHPKTGEDLISTKALDGTTYWIVKRIPRPSDKVPYNLPLPPTESQQRKETPDKDNNTIIIIIMDQDFFLISANFMAIQCMLLFTSETQPRFIFIRCFASRYYLSNDMQRISNRMILATKKHPVY